MSDRTMDQRFSTKRIGSIFSRMTGDDHAAKLTKGQKDEIQKVLSKTPSACGLPKEFWDVPQLKDYVYARFGTVYESERSYHFLLEFGDLSFKVPDRFNVKRNEQKTESGWSKFMKRYYRLWKTRIGVVPPPLHFGPISFK